MLCMANKPTKAWTRNDVANYWKKHGGEIDNIVEELHREIETRTVHFPEPRLSERVDRSNGKTRIITIEDIKEQYYDYIAYHGLDELAGMIGEYQIACVPGKGPVLGAKIIKGWLKDETIKYCIKADLRHCYPSITRENMMSFLQKRVKNDALLYLIDLLLASSPNDGLPIGSYLSIRLCALYLSQLYQHIGGTYFKRGKNVVKHVMFFLDDMFIFGANARAMHKAFKGINAYAESLGLSIKSDWKMLSLNPSDKHAHIDAMGYRIYRDHITMRRRDYIKTKRAFQHFRRSPCYKTAKSAVAYHGLFIKHTDSFRFRNKYRVKRLFRKARLIISDHDKSNVLREAGAGHHLRSDRNHDPVSDLCS